MKKNIILYLVLIVIVIICALLIFGDSLFSNIDRREDIELRDCQTEEEVLDALESISLYMKVEEVRKLFGNEDGDVGSGFVIHLYKINEVLSVRIFYDSEYRVQLVYLINGGESKKIELQYKRIETYDGLEPQEAFDRIFEDYDYNYIENKNYFLVKGLLRDAEEFGKNKLIYKSDKGEYYDYIYMDPNSAEYTLDRFINLEVSGHLFEVEFCKFQGMWIIRIKNRTNKISDIRIFDSTDNFSRLDSNNTIYWMNVLDDIEKNYEIFVEIDGEKMSLIKGNKLLDMLYE